MKPLEKKDAWKCPRCGSSPMKVREGIARCPFCGGRFHADDIEEFGENAMSVNDLDTIFGAFDFSEFYEEGKNPFEDD